jgi:NAD(P)-dependent dehydrogenase (short-subunit alcohol dehydrogenase family)
MSTLANKTALVTGASRGMGRATALAFAAAGARVVVHYGRNADEAKSVVDQIRAAGGHADAVPADLAAPDGAHALAVLVRDLVGDRLDIIVANAGISKAAAMEEITVADFDSLFAVNVRAPYFLVQQLLPILGSGSNIILLSSLRSERMRPSARCLPTPRPRAPSTPWSSILPLRSARAASASTPSLPA